MERTQNILPFFNLIMHTLNYITLYNCKIGPIDRTTGPCGHKGTSDLIFFTQLERKKIS